MKRDKDFIHFWKWFVWFSERFAGFERGSEEENAGFFVDEVKLHLYRICAYLSFDFHPARDDKRARLVITANAIPHSYQTARQLVSLSPPLENLEVSALRQPGDLDGSIPQSFPDFPYAAQDLYFDYHIDNMYPYWI
ncbi:MAG: hypothetical protein JST39_12075 [Bacteroidetes bacterium]|nr:hypothetical protein [Bacteroidota bacterium]